MPIAEMSQTAFYTWLCVHLCTHVVLYMYKLMRLNMKIVSVMGDAYGLIIKRCAIIAMRT